MSLDVGFASQAPSLPGGSASTAGLGETFAPDLSTGTGTFAVPLDVPNGPNDIGPKLSLRYDSGSPSGAFGLGWSIPLPRLLRSGAQGRPRYDDSDTLVLEGSGPLVRGAGTALRPQVDTGDWRIEPAGGGFVATDRAGTRYELGVSADSTIAAAHDATWAWLIHRIEDNLGFGATFSWRAAGSQRYLERVSYGSHEIRLQYEPRPDRLRSAAAGFVLETAERCRAIELHLAGAPASLVRRWELGYGQLDPSGASALTSVRLSGFAADGESHAAPPLTLAYVSPQAPRLVRVPALDEGSAPPPLDGGGRVELVDWHGDGLADVVEIGRDGAARVWRNEGGMWGRPRSTGFLPQLSAGTANVGLLDIDGDGLADFVRVDIAATGYQPRTADGIGRPVTWRRSPAVAFGAANTRLADLDGDGRPELMWSAGSSILLGERDEAGDWRERPSVVATGGADAPPADLEDRHVFVADMNGDGSPELVRVDGGGVTWWAHLGGGEFAPPVRMGTPPVLPPSVDPGALYVVDLDGEGCADVLLVQDGAVTWWPNCGGDHFNAPRTIARLPTGAMSAVRVADLLGTGAPQLCFTVPTPAGRSRWYALDLLGGTRPGLLNTVDNGVGRETSISYTTSALEAARDRAAGRPWASRLPMALAVVSQLRVADTATAREDVTRYRYHEGRYDGVLREVCGFAEVEQDEVGDEHVPTLRTTRWFHTGTRADGTEPGSAAERRRARAVRGRLRAQLRSTPAGYRFDRIDHDWEVADGDDPRIVVPRLRRTTTSTIEGAASPVSRVVTEVVAWDGDGNVVEAVEQSFDGAATVATQTLRTRTTFATDPVGRYRQRVCRIRQSDGADNVLADSITEYDHRPFGAVGSEGLVTRRTSLVLTDELVTDVYGAAAPDLAALGYSRSPQAAGWWIDQASYDRTQDGAGIGGSVTGPLGATTRLALDPTGSYPARVEDPNGNALSVVYDPRLCQPTSLLDASGSTTTVRHDPLARVVAQIEAGDTVQEPTVAYAYRTDVIPMRIDRTRRSGASEQPVHERQFLDGSGKVIEQRATDDEGEIVEVTTTFGSRGLPVRVYLPVRADGPEYTAPAADRPHLAFFYDAIGRVIRTERPDGGVRTVLHAPGLVEEADEEATRADADARHAGARTRRHIDAAGRVHRLEQTLDGRTIAATTSYDAKGALAAHVTATGTTTRFRRDLLGRTLFVQRPEGSQIVLFDAAGNHVETRSGTHAVHRTFDRANRLTAVRHGSVDTEPVMTLTYHDNGAPAPADAGAHTAGGRLVRVDDESGATVFDYDARGRIARKTMTPAGGPTLALELEHRSDGRIAAVTYPAPGGGAGPRIDYAYNRRGLLRSIGGIIDATGYDLAGRRVLTRFANGTVEQATHDPLTGWLGQATIAGPGGALRSVALTHDRAGNVLELASPDAELSWTYEYDDLYRLVGATTAAAAIDYAYDDDGNLTSSSDVGAFAYGDAGAPPTALTAAGADRFTYDDRGVMASGPWGTHTLDAEGRLRRIDLAGGGRHEFTYGHNGALVRRRAVAADGSARETISPDALVSIDDGALVLRFTDGERIVAREASGGARQFLHHDHLGSLVMITDAAGGELLKIRYGPYGEELARSGAAVEAEGFGAGSAVVPGLVLLGARWYCPRVGRFVSPDPLVTDVHDPLAWNAYVYARANPTSFVDPSGRSFWKVFGMIAAAVAIIAVVVVVSVFTFGIGTPAAIAVGSITWGAVFAATMVGVVAGGVIGGIAAARAGGDAGDVLLGVLVGGAVGGWAAFGAAFAGGAVGGALGSGMFSGAVAGGVAGTINGAAMGFASGFAGGRNNGIGDVMEKVLVGAVVGLVVGAALGALSGYAPSPKHSPSESAGPAPGGSGTSPAAGPGPGGGLPGAGPPPPPSPYATNLVDAGAIIAPKVLAKGWEIFGSGILSALAPYAGTVTQTILVDLHAAGASAFWDDIKKYVRTNNVNIPPIKGGGDF